MVVDLQEPVLDLGFERIKIIADDRISGGDQNELAAFDQRPLVDAEKLLDVIRGSIDDDAGVSSEAKSICRGKSPNAPLGASAMTFDTVSSTTTPAGVTTRSCMPVGSDSDGVMVDLWLSCRRQIVE